MKSGDLNFLEPSGPLQACITGLIYLYLYLYKLDLIEKSAGVASNITAFLPTYTTFSVSDSTLLTLTKLLFRS